MELSTEMRDVLAAAADIFDGGVLELRTGAAPGANAADAGTLVASITLPTPWVSGPSNDGQLVKAGTWEDASANNAGTVGHFRIKQSGDGGGADATQERIEGSVTATSGGGDMEMDNVVVASGQQVTVSSATVTVPAS